MRHPIRSQGYFEFNPVVRVAIPEAILMMIASFGRWFGSERARQLRRWCITRGWPLAWAHSPADKAWPPCQVSRASFVPALGRMGAV